MEKRRTLHFIVQETESQLSKLVEKAETLREKQRMRMLLLYKRDRAVSCSELAPLVGVGRRTITDWIKLYEKQGIEALRERGRNHQSKNRSSEITSEMRAALLERNTNPDTAFRSYKEAWLWLKDTYSITLGYPRTYDILHDQMKLRLRVPRPVHIKKDVERAEDFKKKFAT